MEAKPRRALTRSLIIGAVTVPAIALVAVALSAPPDDPAPAAANQEPVAVAAPAGVKTAAAPQTVAAAASGRDYRLACGADGRALVKRARAGKASEIEEAALAALRPICEARGKPLPGSSKPIPEVVIETVAAPVVAAAPAVSQAPAAPVVDSDDDSDDEWDDSDLDDSDDDSDDDDWDDDDWDDDDD